jgi:hypothetical protein
MLKIFFLLTYIQNHKQKTAAFNYISRVLSSTSLHLNYTKSSKLILMLNASININKDDNDVICYVLFLSCWGLVTFYTAVKTNTKKLCTYSQKKNNMLMANIAVVIRVLLVKVPFVDPRTTWELVPISIRYISHFVSNAKILYSLAWAIYKLTLAWGSNILNDAFSLAPTLMDGVTKDT